MSSTTLTDQIWRWNYRFYSRGRFTLKRMGGTVDQAALPVIMCLWNRRERIRDIVEIIQRQGDERPLRLILWSNNTADSAWYRRQLRELWPSGGPHSVELVSSRVNLGGVARFCVASRLRADGYRGPFVMLDDDQDVGADFVSTLVSEYQPKTVTGFWAWHTFGAYNNRTECEVGERADYVGTGGCITDIDLVEGRRFFAGLPTRYAFVEDLWMSYYAASLGWPLIKSAVQADFVMDETNQFRQLFDIKEEFYELLNSEGYSY
jgi:hypothetical protein